MAELRIERAGPAHRAAWLAMRARLWPEAPLEVHAAEIDAMPSDPDLAAFVALADGSACGFAEAALRHDYVNGCSSSPVAFLEGLYVEPAQRRRGVARALTAAVADWGREQGASELASDALIDNHHSHAMHRALGFAETERVVYFRREL